MQGSYILCDGSETRFGKAAIEESEGHDPELGVGQDFIISHIVIKTDRFDHAEVVKEGFRRSKRPPDEAVVLGTGTTPEKTDGVIRPLLADEH